MTMMNTDYEEPQQLELPDLAQLIERGHKALKWIENEHAIAKTVFKPGDKRRARKLGERTAMRLYIQDVLALLEMLAKEPYR